MYDRIWIDNAATSWPKPPAVIAAIADFYRECGGAAGRGNNWRSREAENIVAACRQRIRQLFSPGDSDQVVFAHNGTDGLNLAIHGVLRPGDHVVATTLEHNSVLRPLYHWRDQHGVRVDLLAPESDGQIDPARLAAVVSRETRLVCLNHASNVSGTVQNIESLCDVVSRVSPQTLVLIDASQTAGKLPVDFHATGCDLMVMAGHKGLFGPLGTGLVLVSGRAASQIRPWRQGGTGGNSRSHSQPAEFPHRLEAGNLDVGNIAGLLAGIEFVLETGIRRIREHELLLDQRLRHRLGNHENTVLVGSQSGERIPVCSLLFGEQDVHDVAGILDASFSVDVRAGLHCAPLAAASLIGQKDPAATLRISPGWYNTLEQIDRVADAILQIINSPGNPSIPSRPRG